MANKTMGWGGRRTGSAVWLSLLLLLSACGGGDGTAPQPAAEAQFELPDRLALEARRTFAASESAAASAAVSAVLVKVAEKRVSRTGFEYSYKLEVSNLHSAPWADLQLTLTGAGVGTELGANTATLAFLPIGGKITAEGQLVLRHDRSKPFDATALVWSVAGEQVDQQPVGPVETGVPGKTGSGIAQHGVKVMAVDASSTVAARISIQSHESPKVVPKHLAGAALFRVHGTSPNSAMVVDVPSASVEYIYQCDLSITECMVVPSVTQTSASRYVFPVRPEKYYAVEVN